MDAKVQPKCIEFQKKLYIFKMFPALKNHARMSVLQTETVVILFTAFGQYLQQNSPVDTI